MTVLNHDVLQVAPTRHHIEGSGNSAFSNLQLFGAIAGVPLAVIVLTGWSLSWYPLVLAVLGLPVFAGFNVLFARYAPPLRPQRGLPGKNLEEYMEIKDAELKRHYHTKSKIPIETFFESYFDEKIDIKDDMLELLEARYDWASFTWTIGQVKFFLTQWVPETLWHSKKQDENQVRDHYDRGDDFYNAFLGPMMIYTSGIMTKKDERQTLEEIQQNKLELVSKKIQLKSGDRMLDIGCGWGTLAVHAAKQGAKVTGVTLGKNQTAWGTRKAEEANVASNVNILCMDYRDIPFQKYDKITCLEMAEHVGVLRFQTFLKQVREMLEDDGIFFLQIAGLRRTWQYEDLMWGLFMAKYVFPGADASTPLNWYIEQLERAGFEIESSETLGVHYSTTIYRWYSNWLKNKDKIVAKYGVRWFRIWEYFLAYSTIVARQGSATVYQLVCHKNLNSFDRTRFIKAR
ncbi:S-adenosyl-L-methionine-dependent methyltransferase [Fimicolochytrium jonesii]|uniref:S-adenosyl-L-methionine-dependent methyltransferase n=1 Tax=Fimicolochytrium jonesii TaxID=1396493 RepID=UPI0022FEE45D|nr:S-adenosyl-L-methionine-dependent methyltransferase [Fimicolochytrium jonesii]KAI8816484.1 S-adenosyl-L-methionine-dependent methyltransferase [Fimicolochytrium jonesii]